MQPINRVAECGVRRQRAVQRTLTVQANKTQRGA